MVNGKGPVSAPAKTARRRRRRGRSRDPFNVAGRELLAVGWLPGLPVGGSLGWAALVGHIEPVRASLGLLATAAIVVIVLGADAFRQGGARVCDDCAANIPGDRRMGDGRWADGRCLGGGGVALARAARLTVWPAPDAGGVCGV